MQKYIFILLIGICLIPDSFANNNRWETVSPGVRHSVTNEKTAIHTFEVDLKQYSLKLTHKNYNGKKYPIKQLISPTPKKNLIAINGGFFDRKNQPLGLRFNHKKIHLAKKISWWRIFYIQNKTPYITTSKRFHQIMSTNVSFAIQSGPQLVRNGKTVKRLKPELASRSSIGFDKNNKLLISITQTPINLEDFASELVKLGYWQAINLDGGYSSQLYAQTEALQLYLPNLSGIIDAIVVEK